MDYEIKREEEFTPVVVQITLNTVEEAQEFQARMDLSNKEIRKGREELHALIQEQSVINGITPFRRGLKNVLGDHTLHLKNNA